jgi:hypothetical protein
VDLFEHLLKSVFCQPRWRLAGGGLPVIPAFVVELGADMQAECDSPFMAGSVEISSAPPPFSSTQRRHGRSLNGCGDAAGSFSFSFGSIGAGRRAAGREKVCARYIWAPLRSRQR